MPDVDLVINVFERNYRTVLDAGFFGGVEGANRFGFARRVALINNVDDLEDARTRADTLVATGELDSYYVVADHLTAALSRTGLRKADLGRLPHYSDCSLVAVTLEDGSPWLVYWDADVFLEASVDWISPSLERMERDSRLIVANPLWEDATLESTTIERDGDFAIGQGFSDQVYLVRRADLARRIYRERCIARYRYPVSAVCDAFEARVDSWMRHSGKLRLTYLPARYLHPVRTEGTATETLRPSEWLCHMRNKLVLATLARSPWRPACCRFM